MRMTANALAPDGKGGAKGSAISRVRAATVPPLARYMYRRLMISLIVLVGISMVSFTTVYLLPGDPVTSRFPGLGASQLEAIRAAMGLDQPLPVL
jgi:hypothetical protein